MEAFGINISPFFQWLIKTTMQASVLICLILLIKAVLRHKLLIRWHYYLWLILLVRLALPWSPQSRISIFNLIPQSGSQQTTETVMISDDNITSPVEDTSFAEQAESSTLQMTNTDTEQANSQVTSEQVSQPVILESDEALSVLVETSPVVTSSFVDILPLLWFIGSVILTGYISLRNIFLWRAIKRERQVTDQQILDLLEDCKMQMHIQTIVGVVVTDKVKSPALFGFVRPRLLLPQGLLEELDLDELQYILLHELAHLRRRDIYLGWVVSLLQVLHWFNPLVWYAFRRMRTDQELACDALALSTMNTEEPPRYGKTLVNLFERFSQINYVPSIAGILEDKSQLEKRIKMISLFKKNSYRWSPLAIILIIILGCVSLSNAISTNNDDVEPEALLHEAVADDNIEQVNLLISQGADVDAKDNKGYTPLGIALERNHLEIAEILIANDADVNGEWNFGISYLHYATLFNNGNIVKFLITNGADINAKISGEGLTALELVEQSGYPGYANIVKLLRELGAADDAEPTDSLHKAAAEGDIEQVKLLISQGADVDTKDNKGYAPLGIALEKNHLEIAEILIANGADVNGEWNFGISYLHYATLFGNEKIVKFLITNGADINAKIGGEGLTALELAEQSEFPGYANVVKLLHELGASDDAEPTNSLHKASAAGDIEQVKLLISQGADVDAKDNKGYTPLGIAFEKNHLEIAEILIANDADVNGEWNFGISYLHYATLFNNENIVKLLITNGADINAKIGGVGLTALELAEQKEHTGIVKLLREHGEKE